MRVIKSSSVLVLALFFVSIVLAVILVDGGGTAFASVNESVNTLYNFSVNNTQATENISEVNVTLPSGFVFIVSSNDTDVTASTFTNTSTILTWTNTPLVTNGTLNFFWFNVTSSATPGDYNFTVISSNSSGVFETQNLSVTVNDTVAPSSIEFVSPSEDDNSNISRDNVLVNVTAVDLGTIDTIIIRLYNSSGAQINSSSGSTSPVFINFTNLTDGTYTFNATVNDTTGNSNSTASRTVTVDTVNPTVTFSCTPTSVSAGATITCSCSGTDVTSGVSTTSFTTNPSTSTAGSFSTNCTVTDNAGNSVSSSVSYTVSSTGGGGGGAPTYRPSVSKLTEGYEISLGKNYKVAFEVAGESHTLKVDSISSGKATITISSDPITLEFSVGDTEKVDFNHDGTYDLSINLKSIVSSRANFVLTSISEEAAVDAVVAEEEESVVGAVVEKIEEVVKKRSGAFWVALIVVLLIVGVIVAKKLKK